MKTFKDFMYESTTYNPEHPDLSHHEKEFHRRINSRWPHGVVAYHEAPGHHADSFRKDGIEGEYGIFATVGQPSNFVSSDKKTIVKFRVPANLDVRPDMRYDPDNPHKDFIKQHPNTVGGDISISSERIHPKHIISIEEKG